MTRFLALVVALALAACAHDSTTAPASHIAFGEWGAANAQIVETDSATNVILGCTGGTFAGNVALDPTGSFAVNGTWAPFAGPLAFNGLMPAQLSGQVSGNTLEFAVAVYDTTTKQVLSRGPATVTFGQPAKIVLCP